MSEETEEPPRAQPSETGLYESLNPPKPIVLCIDGTWNHFFDVKTNVYRLSDGLKHTTDQYTQYWNGIGTKSVSVHQGYVDFWLGLNKVLPGARILGAVLAEIIEVAYARLFRLVGGATGYGIAWDLKSAYEYVARSYVEGDRVCLFGFSRGAYTARSFASMLYRCGLAYPEQPRDAFQNQYDYEIANLDHVRRRSEEVVALYRRGDAAEQAAFKRRYCRPVCPIEIIGVWDTVGSLGLPAWLDRLNPWSHGYHDVRLSPEVKHAFHALAIDEKRRSFAPTLWDERDRQPHQTLEQVWFAGDHSDIGGGHGRSGLSDITLRWMIEKAAACGLSFWSDYDFNLQPGCEQVHRPRGLGRWFPTRDRQIPAGPETCLHESVQQMTDDPALVPRYAPANLDYGARLDQTYRIVGEQAPD